MSDNLEFYEYNNFDGNFEQYKILDIKDVKEFIDYIFTLHSLGKRGKWQIKKGRNVITIGESTNDLNNKKSLEANSEKYFELKNSIKKVIKLTS